MDCEHNREELKRLKGHFLEQGNRKDRDYKFCLHALTLCTPPTCTTATCCLGDPEKSPHWLSEVPHND